MAVIATVSPTELIRSTWGNSVATELNTRCVKVDGSMPMTGTLVVTVSPGLSLRNSSNQPFFEFASTTGTRYGYIQGGSTLQKYGVESASGTHTFTVAESTKLTVSNAEVAVTAAFSATGTSTFAAGMTIGSNGGQLNLVDTSTGGSDFYDTHIGFYGGGVSLVSPGVRSGYIGYAGTDAINVVNEISGGNIGLGAGAGGNITMNAAAITFMPSGVERGRVTGSQLLWGKAAADVAATGVELDPTGRVNITGTTSVQLYLRRNDTIGETYMQFAVASGIAVDIRRISGGVQFVNCVATAPSDYRLKDELGPVENAVDRVMTLAPKRLRWKATGETFDGFIAHELDQVVPNAVYGAKDAETPDGSIESQQVNYEAIIPLLVAAVQELAAR